MKHEELLVKPWSVLVNNLKELPYVMKVVVDEGGTRPIWHAKDGNQENFVMAWPKEPLLRAGIIVGGEAEGKPEPKAIFPFMEGYPNTLRIETTYAWKNGLEGEVGCFAGESEQILWFYDPLFFRDHKIDLTEGIEQTFYLSGLCLGLRRALLDEITVTSGPYYEVHAEKWLKENPDKTRLDVPALKVDIQGKRLLAPTDTASEYQARVVVEEVEEFVFGPKGGEKIYRFVSTFGDKENIRILMFVPAKACQKGYVPKAGDEVDMIFWLQGRVVDINPEDVTQEPVQ